MRFYSDERDETMRELHRRAMFTFGWIAPHCCGIVGLNPVYRGYGVCHSGDYCVIFDETDNDKPKIKWDFHSLLQTVQMISSFALTDEAQPLRICKECSKVYYAKDPRSQFCAPDCKNYYNVRKSRNKPSIIDFHEFD